MLADRITIVVGLLLGLLIVTACGTETSKAASGDVVYSARVNGNIDVYRVDDETGTSVRLTTADASDFAPAWSPKKDRIAFISDRNGIPALWVMDWVGESKEQLSGPSTTVAGFKWAPDSRRIGIEISGEDSHWIAVLDIESGQLEPLTSQSEDVRIGGWSPDGEWLLYAVTGGDADGIRRRNPDGVDEITITVGPDINPQWSHNGRWIAFNRLSESGAVDLVVTGKDGGKTTNISPDEFDESSFEWAPDSKHIVFVSESSGNAEIYVVTPDGKVTKQLTSNRVIDASPHWSPNGASILFLSEGDGSFDIYSMGKEGEKQKRMTSISDVILEADW
ncbi:MAG: hypothetical protein O3B95_09495 [Chloroflexi bacterium]|nr:hypothetical protein [Chloroflexota bacterium]